MNANLLHKIQNMSVEEMYAAIYTDHLTGLNNRKALEEMEYSKVAIIDLDSLKYLNDNYGHRVGDAALQDLAETLQIAFGSDRVYRLSGDEFVVIGEQAEELERRLTSLNPIIPGFSFGVGSTLVAADKKLEASKTMRETCGLRASRGECPPWLEARISYLSNK